MYSPEMDTGRAVMRCLAAAGLLVLQDRSRAVDLEPPTAYEGRPIAQVEFVPPTQPVARADLARIFPFQPGAPLHLADVRNAIKQLYATGEYSDIQFETEPSDQGVRLVVRTSEQWFVGPVEVNGKVSAPPNESQLTNVTRLQLGTPFNDEDLEGAIRGMRNLLGRNGLYLSKVEPQIDRDLEHQQVAFIFRVDSGKRARFTAPIVIGDTRLPPADLAKAAKYKRWFRWKAATQANTNQGIQNVRKKYQKDTRLTAEVSLDRAEHIPESNRVRNTIKADGGPKIKMETSGAKISKGKLQEYVPVSDEGTVNQDLLVRGVRNLRDYFQNQGYFDVQADFKTTNTTPDQEEVRYTINLGERHTLVRVDIQGNRYFTSGDIRERMYLQPKGFIRLRHGRYSDGFARSDEDAIKALYRDNGFRDVKVTATAKDDYLGKTGDVAVTIAIEEGPQYLISKINLTGVKSVDASELLRTLATIPEQPFSEANVSLDRGTILTTYQSRGYPDANFDWRIESAPGPDKIAVEYVITEGQPRYVRDVLISGLHKTRESLLTRSILVKPGEPLSWTQMGDMQRRLYNLGVFESVDMAIQNPSGNTENKYVLYHLTEGHRYYVGVGIGGELARIGGSQTSLDNPGGTTGVAPRADLEVSRTNMFGLGHSLNFKSRYSTLDRRASLTYSAPHYHDVEGRNITVSALYDNTRDVLTFTSRRLEGSAQLTKQFSKATTGFWRYTWRNVKVDQNTLKINPLLIPLVSQPSRLGILSATVVQDRRDDPANAHRGFYNSGDLSLVEHYLGGNKNFLRFLGRSSYYKRIKGEYVIASNTEFGWIHPFNVTPGVSAFDYIPLPEHFFGGGSTSHRGFPDNQAGPRDLLTGFPLGGNALLFHSTELRFPLIGSNLEGVFFHDMGNVYRGFRDISFRTHKKDITDFDYMVHAAGFGVRYRTPVGPVRVDLAYSINPPTFNGLSGTYQELLFSKATPTIQNVRHFQFFFSIGQAF